MEDVPPQKPSSPEAHANVPSETPQIEARSNTASTETPQTEAHSNMPSSDKSEKQLVLRPKSPDHVADTDGMDGIVHAMPPHNDLQPLAGYQACFDERYPLEERVQRVEAILAAHRRAKEEWKRLGQQPCEVTGCGVSHPPPCFKSEQGEHFRDFRKKSDSVLKQWRKAQLESAESLAVLTEDKGDAEDPASKNKGKKKGWGLCQNCAKKHRGGVEACTMANCEKAGCGLAHPKFEPCREAHTRFLDAGLLRKKTSHEAPKKSAPKGKASKLTDDDVGKLGAVWDHVDASQLGKLAGLVVGTREKGAPKGRPLEKKRKAKDESEPEGEDESEKQARDSRKRSKKSSPPRRQDPGKSKGARKLNNSAYSHR
jgi:hypothetical protein